MTTWIRALRQLNTWLQYKQQTPPLWCSLTFELVCYSSSFSVYSDYFHTSQLLHSDRLSTIIQQCSLSPCFRRARGGLANIYCFKEVTRLLPIIVIKPLHPAWIRKARIVQENPFSWYTGPGGTGLDLSRMLFPWTFLWGLRKVHRVWAKKSINWTHWGISEGQETPKGSKLGKVKETATHPCPCPFQW